MAFITRNNRRPVALIGVAVLSLMGAFTASRFFAAPPPPPVVVQAPVPREPTKPRVDPTVVAEILIAKRDLDIGRRLTAEDFGWQYWPRAYLPQNAILKEKYPNAVEGMINTAVRTQISSGDVMREDKVVRAKDQSGLLAAMLPPGMRAVAIRLDPTGAGSSGNFILPGDSVDVISVAQGGRPDADGVKTLMANVKVIAINQALAASPGQSSMAGQTATLMLSPEDGIRVADAERKGKLSLVLRSTVDAGKDKDRPAQIANKVTNSNAPARSVEMLRFGMSGR